MYKSKWIVAALLAPGLLVVALTTTYPLLAALYFSFHNYKLTRPVEWAIQLGGDSLVTFNSSALTLDNYIEAFTDDRFINSVVVTAEFTFISVGLSVVIGLAIALLLQKDNLWSRMTKTILILPFAISPALKGYSWRFMLNENFGIFDLLIDVFVAGPINALISIWNALPFGDVPLMSTTIVWLGDSFWALVMLAFSETWGWAPLIALMFIGALGSIDSHIFESARIDGANSWQIFTRVTLPILRPVILVIVMLKTIFSLKMFDQVVTMTGGGPVRATQTINFYVHQVGFVRGLEIGYASALSYILVFVLTILAAGYVMYLLKPDYSRS
ncbi:MAG: sugar ABC transporter permease [Anaerolineae bacterium]|nr:sugar ABC transporter permease [Anaerolineae bacterium]